MMSSIKHLAVIKPRMHSFRRWIDRAINKYISNRISLTNCTIQPIFRISLTLRFMKLMDTIIPANCSLIMIVALMMMGAPGFGASATWTANPGSGDWNTEANWNAGAVPDGPNDTATFGLSSTTAVVVSDTTEVYGITFTLAAISPYTISVDPAVTFTLNGAGILNDSGQIQNFVTGVNSNCGGQSGAIVFSGTATAGNLTTFTNDGGASSGAVGGAIYFEGDSSAGSATITNDSGTGGGLGGATYFTGSSDGGTARAITNGDGIFDISGLTDSGMNIGSIEGSGTYYLGDKILTVGGNNLSTILSGGLDDGGAYGGTGGSLVKTGTGTLTLAGSNSYTGSTTVSMGTLAITGVIDTASGIFKVDGGGANAPVASLSGSGILSTFEAYIGYSGTGSFTQTGSASSHVIGYQFTLGQNAGSSGSYNLAGGNLFTFYSDIGTGGAGNFVQSGGTNYSLFGGSLGYSQGATGSYNLSGGLLNNGETLYVGYNGAGSFTQSAGTDLAGSYLSGNLTLGYNSGATGTYNLSGGSLSAVAEYVGLSGTGVFIQTGGTNTISFSISSNPTGSAAASALYLADLSGSGSYTLDGGTLNTPAVDGYLGTSIFNFNGGTLQANESDTIFFEHLTTANVQAGGAIVDTNGYNDTIAQSLLHDTTPGAPATDGGLTKVGLGALTLTGTNTYTGPTMVEAGTLTLTDGGSLGGTAVTVGLPGSPATLFIAGQSTTIGTSGTASLTPDSRCRLALPRGRRDRNALHRRQRHHRRFGTGRQQRYLPGRLRSGERHGRARRRAPGHCQRHQHHHPDLSLPGQRRCHAHLRSGRRPRDRQFVRPRRPEIRRDPKSRRHG